MEIKCGKCGSNNVKLDKETPMKIYSKTICPRCYFDYKHWTYKVNYCPECGQHIDWSE